MLYRTSVKDIKDGRVTRRSGYLAVVMQYYPRFLKKEMIDEYVHSLAPDRVLFTEFKEKDRELKDHDAAFATVEYEKRFALTDEGLANLERLSALSRERDVILICQCLPMEKCHADLLLLLAKKHFAASTQRIRPSYPEFEARLIAS